MQKLARSILLPTKNLGGSFGSLVLKSEKLHTTKACVQVGLKNVNLNNKTINNGRGGVIL